MYVIPGSVPIQFVSGWFASFDSLDYHELGQIFFGSPFWRSILYVINKLDRGKVLNPSEVKKNWRIYENDEN